MRKCQNLPMLVKHKDTGSQNVRRLDGNPLAGSEDSKGILGTILLSLLKILC